MKQFIFATMLLFSCGLSETDKRNAYMSELIGKRNAYQKQLDSAKGVLAGLHTKMSQANIAGQGIGNYDSITGPTMDAIYMAETNLEDVQKEIDSLKLIK
jgi:hypothetical protein